jgi:xanthine dehydrogenase FAD-binding subunit
VIPKLDIIVPSTVEEILTHLDSEKENLRIIAGGTDVVPGFHIESPRFKGFTKLLDINKVVSLQSISETNESIHIGACSTFTQIVNNDLISEKLPVLKKAAHGIGSKQIRNKATIAGNFVNNAPCADSVPALLVYDAKLKIESLHSSRIVNLNDFLEGPYKTNLLNNEIVTQIIIPKSSIELKGDFYKLGRRRAVAVSRITLGLLYHITEGIFTEIRIASGAVTPIGQRFKEIEQFARNQKVTYELLKDISIKAGEKVLELTGLRWSSPHKLPVLQKSLYNLLVKNCLD